MRQDSFSLGPPSFNVRLPKKRKLGNRVTDKRCTKCDLVKPYSEFHNDKSRNDGKFPQCKTCVRVNSSSWYAKNREKHSAYSKEWYLTNRDSVRQKAREYRRLNHEAITEYKRQWYDANRDQVREKQREYYKNNKEKWVVSRARNRRSRLEYQKLYQQDNAEYYRALQRACQSKRRALNKSLPYDIVRLHEIALRDGNHCWMCSDELSELNPAHLDHLVPLAADADLLATWGIDNPGTVHANMALACPACNLRKSNRVMPCAIARYLFNVRTQTEVAA